MWKLAFVKQCGRLVAEKIRVQFQYVFSHQSMHGSDITCTELCIDQRYIVDILASLIGSHCPQ